MKVIKRNWQLAVILILASVLRFWQLASVPIGFNDDEAAFGYNAFSILTTGRDEWGKLLPFPVFESFGDWKLVGYLYLTVISQFIFGASELATRLPSALFGVLAVWATYLLTKKLFEEGQNGWQEWKGSRQRAASNFFLKTATDLTKNTSTKVPATDGRETTDRTRSGLIALVAALLLAISPWHIVASRNAFESDVQIFFLTLGTYFFLKALKNTHYIFPAIVLSSICLYIYRSSWLFVPLFALTLVVLFRSQLQMTKTILSKVLILTVVLTLPLVPTVLSFRGQSRFLQESLVAAVAKSGIVDDVNTRRGACQKNWPQVICVLVYNQYLFYFSTYLNNYIANLSPETYFIRGNPGGYQSFSIRSLFYTFELPLLLVGIFLLTIQKHQAAKVLIPWILIVPIGPSITGVGNPGRLNIIMPAVQIIAAFGFLAIFNYLKNNSARNLLALVSLVIIISSLTRFIADLFVYYPRVSGSFQRYGYRELFGYLESQKDNWQQIAISRQTDDAKQYIHYLFSAKVSPNIFNDREITVKYRGEDGWQVVERIGKFHFWHQTPKISDLPPKTLLAVGANEVSFRQEPTFVAKYLNGDVAFEVYDVDQVKLKLNEK